VLICAWNETLMGWNPRKNLKNKIPKPPEILICVCVLVLPPIPNCEEGHVQPMFLSRTPSHGDVLHATVGQMFQLFAEAQAHHATYWLLFLPVRHLPCDMANGGCLFISAFISSKYQRLPSQRPPEHDQRVQRWQVWESRGHSELDATAQWLVQIRSSVLHRRN